MEKCGLRGDRVVLKKLDEIETFNVTVHGRVVHCFQEVEMPCFVGRWRRCQVGVRSEDPSAAPWMRCVFFWV